MIKFTIFAMFVALMAAGASPVIIDVRSATARELEPRECRPRLGGRPV